MASKRILGGVADFPELGIQVEVWAYRTLTDEEVDQVCGEMPGGMAAAVGPGTVGGRVKILTDIGKPGGTPESSGGNRMESLDGE